MKPEELQLGDIVTTTPSGMPIRVVAIHRKKVAYHACTDRLSWVRIGLLQPIPLTPEILARMGFTIDKVLKYDDTYTEDEYTATMKCVDSRKCEVEIEYKAYCRDLRAFNYDPHNRLGFTSIETQVECVHELQHVMRLCGLDKEIQI